ncbi:MAG: phenylacetic acid degradation protein [Rhizobiales bacterium PAR1]|nr:MAG: phenylacetic acid degradation protein [Rhizobiales bacterium PAR1]
MSRFAPLPPDIYDRMTGLEILQAMVRGEMPGAPIAQALNFSLVEVDHGRAVFAGEPTADYLNPHGSVHGGWAAAVMDSALGCAVHTTLALGEKYTTVEMKVNYLRPIFPGKPGRLICEGKVINRGRTLALSEARLVDLEGRVYAHGTETCMIFPKA